MTTPAAAAAASAPPPSTTGQIQDGLYQISNVKYTGMLANFASGNIGTPVTDTDSAQDQATYWWVRNTNVHGQYTIQSYSFQSSWAATGANPSPGDIIKAKSTSYSWNIVENTGKAGQYFISPVSDDIYWYVSSNTKGINVTFNDGGGDDCQWTFNRAGGFSPNSSGTTIGVIQNGTYQLTNVKYTSLYGFLADGNARTPVTSTTSSQDDRTKWIVTQTNTAGQYTVENYRFQDSYASVGANPVEGDAVKANLKTYTWTIKENTGAQGQYYITPVGSDLYWYLLNSQASTSVTLNSGGDTDSQWAFVRV